MLQFSSLVGRAMEAANHSKNSAVEADTISKHGTVSKNHTSRRNFFKKAILALLVASIFSVSSCDKDDNKDDGTYHFIPPSSWTEGTAVSGIPTYTGPVDGTFSPNINIVTESFNEALKEYVDASIASLPLFLSNFNLISRTSFQTNSGLSGEKIVHSSTVGGMNIRQIQYIFPPKSGSKIYVVITASGLLTWDNKYDATFDTAAKSFAWK